MAHAAKAPGQERAVQCVRAFECAHGGDIIASVTQQGRGTLAGGLLNGDRSMVDHNFAERRGVAKGSQRLSTLLVGFAVCEARMLDENKMRSVPVRAEAHLRSRAAASGQISERKDMRAQQPGFRRIGSHTMTKREAFFLK